jgi:CBS domain-containing protein
LADEDEQPAGWLARLTDRPNARAERYARSHGATAREVMTDRVVTVAPDATASHVAHLMEQHGIRRVLVAEQGRLLGMVTRTDLLRALVADQPPEGEASDERIRAAILAAMRRESWADTLHTTVNVRDGRGGVPRLQPLGLGAACAARPGRERARREERGGQHPAAPAAPRKLRGRASKRRCRGRQDVRCRPLKRGRHRTRAP